MEVEATLVNPGNPRKSTNVIDRVGPGLGAGEAERGQKYAE